jgi:hypothetical protein
MADKILTPFGAYAGTAAATVVPATGTVVANETGFDSHRITTIDIADLSLIVTTNASKGDGKLIYTFPAGKIVVKRTTLSIGVVGTAALNVADTPEIGVGTVVATGAIATLGAGAATMENLFDGTAISACDNTAYQGSQSLTLAIAAAGVHNVYLNIADGWAGIDAGMKATGRVIIEWAYMS